MKKRIGFIDHYLDEWHANNYPRWIRESPLGSEFEVANAWAEKDREGGVGTAAWCGQFGVKPHASLESLIAESDCLVVLSPDHPERHEDLCRLVAKSKKPVYVDKTFAPDLAAAKRIFERFEKNETPMFSSSALRFAGEMREVKSKGLHGKAIRSVVTRGQGIFERYAVHQLEMIVALMGTGIRGVMNVGSKEAAHLVFDFDEGRRAQLSMIQGMPYQLAVHGGEVVFVSNALKGDFFTSLIESMLSFFKDPSVNPVSKDETLEIIAAIDAGKQALAAPDRWIPIGSA